MNVEPKNVTDQFLGIFKWYCGEINLTLGELVAQLSKRFNDPEQWTKIWRSLLIDDPVQLNAERTLCSLVEKIPERTRTVRRWNTNPGREVDWGQTWLAQKTSRPAEFCSLVRTPIPDMQLLQALAGIVSRWRRILESIPVASAREERIRKLRKIESMLPNNQSPWSLSVSRRLKRIDDRATIELEAAIRLWEGEGNRGAALAEQFGKWLQTDHAKSLKANNGDTLFEWTVALTITRAAVEKEGWKIISVGNAAAKSEKYGDILLRRKDLWLRISKGKPRDGCGKDLPVDHENIVMIAQKQAGLNPTGFQPDIVLTFYRDGKPEAATFLADAKRNMESDGHLYISTSIQKAAVYVYAFKSLLVSKPCCTLFFWQGVTRLLDVQLGLNQEPNACNKVVEKMKDNNIPDILCFDQWVMGDNRDILGAWLSCLVKKGEESLR